MHLASRRVVALTCIMMIVDSRSFFVDRVNDHLQTYNAHTIKNYEKRAELMDTEYVAIDQHGQAYVNCTYNMDGVIGIRKCTLAPSDAAFDMGFACFALWSSAGEIIAQDCWINQVVALEQCQKDGCVSATTYDAVNFCCCFGHMCNGKLNMT